jgi:hypothetical protein
MQLRISSISNQSVVSSQFYILSSPSIHTNARTPLIRLINYTGIPPTQVKVYICNAYRADICTQAILLAKSPYMCARIRTKKHQRKEMLVARPEKNESSGIAESPA